MPNDRERIADLEQSFLKLLNAFGALSAAMESLYHFVQAPESLETDIPSTTMH